MKSAQPQRHEGRQARAFVVGAALSLCSLCLCGSFLLCRAEEPASIRIGSKSDVEGSVLGELAVLLVRSANSRAEYRRLGGTAIVWQALRNGEIDAYPEYTGTLRQEIFAGRGLRSDDDLRKALAELGIRMSKPLGFNNTYAIGMKEERAERLGIRTLSDLARHPELKLGLSNEFMGRADGWPSLRQQYALPHSNVTGMDHTLAYQALVSRAIDATDLYSTDAKIRTLKLRVLEDDQKHFPPYEAVLLYRAELEERAPRAVQAMLRLEGSLSEAEIIELNARVSEDRMSPLRVAADFLQQRFAIRSEIGEESAWAELGRHTLEHLWLVTASLLAAIVLALPLGIAAARFPTFGQGVLAGVGILQTIPSLALLVFMIPLLGTGGAPAMAALFLYSLLPIVRNTYTGLREITPALLESAEALGLSAMARLRLIELPLAARTILAGIKTAAVINVGTATIGALIGAGGYGQAIITGIQHDDKWLLIMQGAVPAALMALAVQGLFELAERAVVPRGLRLKSPEN